MSIKICVIPGDGIGKEVIPVAVNILKELSIPIKFYYGEAGYDCYQKTGQVLPSQTVSLAQTCKAILFGAVTTPPKIKNYRSAILALRKNFDLFANLRPSKSWNLPDTRKNIDLLIVRENTEGLYIGKEKKFRDYAESKRIISEKGSYRIIKKACILALRRKKHVTVVHKANILRETDGIFIDQAEKIALEYPQIKIDFMLVDTIALKMVQNPSQFDVIVTTNLFGDILSDLAAGLIGGLGLAPSASIGYQKALFEPVHGSAPDIAGQNKANPLSAVLSTTMMLDYLNYPKLAKLVDKAVQKSIKDKIISQDLGGNYTTKDIEDYLIKKINSLIKEEQL